MKISRLRLLGFKSFVEPTELIIERGLTGVVGPNGCGKSNLLEALRWVMGETSHKSMRAAAMDDVIFSGTTTRPQRNTAEVTIFLDNTARLAPAEWNGDDTIEITRRIEREAGSAYRINGKEARARDIKILFEDAATGARSPALVRQGQIGEIVNAKPEARRRVLEDAAGIAGLHSRRHEAELRLKAAEGNLARLNDVLGGLNGQIESLKRQARAARRYKEVSEEIRRQEALYFHLAWSAAQGDVEAGEASLAEELSRLALATQAEAKAITDEAELAEAMPPLREIEAKRGALVGRLRIESETFEREAERAANRQRELIARIEQLSRDMAREESFVAEAREIIARLDAEITGLDEAEGRSGAAAAEARQALAAAEGELKAAEQALSEVTHRMAEARARRRSLEGARLERAEATTRIERRLAALEAQGREIAARAPDASKLVETTETGQRLVREIAEIEGEAAAAEDLVRERAEIVEAKRQEAAKARLAVSAIATERETLAKLLVPPRESDVPAIVDQLRVAPGYEAALAAALGDDLDAPAGENGPVHWRMLDAPSDDARLPAEAELLASHVDSPPELRRRLKQIGVVPRELGMRLQARLAPGQRLVSREGDLWRWDGFVAASEVTTVAAQRLAERNRLAVIEYEEAEARETADLLGDAEGAAQEALAEAEAKERHLRQQWREQQSALARAREAMTALERAARETESRIAS
ncbi:MAG: chromosome segregation SMC family protein, partial [Pseudomonadota bacterium]